MHNVNESKRMNNSKLIMNQMKVVDNDDTTKKLLNLTSQNLAQNIEKLLIVMLENGQMENFSNTLVKLCNDGFQIGINFITHIINLFRIPIDIITYINENYITEEMIPQFLLCLLDTTDKSYDRLIIQVI